MKKSTLLVILSLFALSCSMDNAKIIETGHDIDQIGMISDSILFYDNNYEMSDTKDEQLYVDSLVALLKRNENNPYRTKATDEMMPLTPEQYVKFLKCMNVSIKSKGEFLLAFVDKNDGKVLEFSENPSSKFCKSVDKATFFGMLSNDNICFKLVKSKDNLPQIDLPKELPIISKATFNDENLPIGCGEKQLMIDATASIMYGVNKLNACVTWVKKIPMDGFEFPTDKELIEPKVLTVNTFTTYDYIGTYTHLSHISNYVLDELKIETMGIIKIRIDLLGFVAGMTYKVKSYMNIDVERTSYTYTADVV